jgi:GTP-binding nuclear protein Ran
VFNPNYVPTLGVDVSYLTFQTNYGPVVFDVWDTAGQEKFSGLGDGYAVGAKAMIGFFDVTSIVTSVNLMRIWLSKEYANLLSRVPVVVCGNKCDINADRKSKQPWKAYFDVSAKSNYNFEAPFLYLARLLTGHDDLEFTISDAVIPPECTPSKYLDLSNINTLL